MKDETILISRRKHDPNTYQRDIWIIKTAAYDRWMWFGDITRQASELHWHKIGKPAVFCCRYDMCEWWVDNSQYLHTIRYCEACDFDEETTLMWVLKYGHELPNKWDYDDFARE